jgi:hypothetical protein
MVTSSPPIAGYLPRHRIFRITIETKIAMAVGVQRIVVCPERRATSEA